MQAEINKYYYTFGTSKAFPYQGGWVEVKATNLKISHEIFRLYFPDKVKGILNCADYYTEEQFKETKMYETGNHGSFCHVAI